MVNWSKSSILTLNFTIKSMPLRRQWLEVKSCVLFLVLSHFSLVSFPHPHEQRWGWIRLSQATTSSLDSLTFQWQADTWEQPNSMCALPQLQKEASSSLSVSSGKMVALFWLSTALLDACVIRVKH